jgi:hypothetical protein
VGLCWPDYASGVAWGDLLGGVSGSLLVMVDASVGELPMLELGLGASWGTESPVHGWGVALGSLVALQQAQALEEERGWRPWEPASLSILSFPSCLSST